VHAEGDVALDGEDIGRKARGQMQRKLGGAHHLDRERECGPDCEPVEFLQRRFVALADAFGQLGRPLLLERIQKDLSGNAACQRVDNSLRGNGCGSGSWIVELPAPSRAYPEGPAGRQGAQKLGMRWFMCESARRWGAQQVLSSLRRERSRVESGVGRLLLLKRLRQDL
jgi:hypothetical protein